jgi:hypothetical protein
MAKENKKAEVFTLVMDKDRQMVFNLLAGGYMQITTEEGELAANVLTRSLIEFNLEEAFEGMLAEVAEKTHELGWCEDPDCLDHK